MSAKTSTEVVIDGKVYTLSGYEEIDYLQSVAAYLNKKICEFDIVDGYRHLPANMKSTMLELNVADDYFKARAQIDKLEEDRELKEKELYDLKHELVQKEMELEELQEQMKKLEKQMEELQKQVDQKEEQLKEEESNSRDVEELWSEAEQRIKQLEIENKELKLGKERLESALEDTIFGNSSGHSGKNGKRRK